MTMPKLKLSYFDAHGGRGEPARLALSIAGIAFEDDRIPGADWPKRKPSTPFGALPVLEVDGRVLTQSGAINRYVGKLADLYPTDPWQAALCDEVIDAVEDVDVKIGATFGMTEEQKQVERPKLASGPIPLYLRGLQTLLEAHGGEYFAGGRLSIADLKVFVFVRRLQSGKLDYMPTDLPDRLAPKLVAHCQRIKNLPGVKAYYAKHGVT
ncbi:MAG: glutathione S-transferase family protein [Polyangiales bacterium]